MSLVDALASPDLRQRHEPFAEFLSRRPVNGHVLRGDRHFHLMEQELDVLADLVALLTDDRDLTRLGDDQSAQLFQLGGGGVAPGEDPEVDPDLEAGGLLLHGEGDDVFDLH